MEIKGIFESEPARSPKICVKTEPEPEPDRARARSRAYGLGLSPSHLYCTGAVVSHLIMACLMGIFLTAVVLLWFESTKKMLAYNNSVFCRQLKGRNFSQLMISFHAEKMSVRTIFLTTACYRYLVAFETISKFHK